MFQQQELSRKIFIVIVFIVLSRMSTCESLTLEVKVSEKAIFNFTYPCDSTKITLRHSYRLPFYNSNNPRSIPLPPNYLLENQNDTARNECSLHLTINPVSRDDEGTYILTAYKNGDMLPDYLRIWLNVDYPPGKASCELSNDYNDGEWVSLQCTAPVGTLPGQIVCYQNDTRLPPKDKLGESGRHLNQIILARLDGLVYCCSSILTGMKDKCECTDWRWDPVSDSVSDIADPCPQAMSTEDPTSTHSITIDNIPSLSSYLGTTPTKYPENPKNNSNWKMTYMYAPITVISVWAIITVSIALCMYRRKAKELARLQRSITPESTDPCLPVIGEEVV